ncbi:hypothetical protein AB0G60_02610 [Streptomyces angustmyceticus]|uniref:Uncharacterized protein n=1 Tax=Streptomyces angustmyceticus TaxID=285578 RepID=A0A5J4L9E4_9ACTN|nr:hypothetical protein [Streptomyces angustmyceticus]UAL65555.1 hypothetical protein K7396_02585 [Streptomyces angustmyceticus]GES27926.1 hypothetical protein San01_04130 [Streptomyces angustmyceticus]
MADHRIGQTVDALGVTADLDDEDMVTDCIVLLKVLQADGTIAMSIGTTDSTDWINQKGLLHSALELTEGHYRAVGDD